MGWKGPPVLLECVPMHPRGYGVGGGATLSTGRNMSRPRSPGGRGAARDFDAGEKRPRRSLDRWRMPAAAPRSTLPVPLDSGGSMLRRSFPICVLVVSALIVLLAP